MEKQKYVKLKEYGVFIIFSPLVPHNDMKHLGVVSAGFCYVDAKNEKIDCFGESIGVGLKSNEYEDSVKATMQIFGSDAGIRIMNKDKTISK
jgi:hypothetical protein